jgi:hypothetical protein
MDHLVATLESELDWVDELRSTRMPALAASASTPTEGAR